MLLKFLGLIAVVSVAMCLVPAGAHFFELTNKMSMSQPEYMTVQKIYAGWSFFGIAVIAALLITVYRLLKDHGLITSPAEAGTSYLAIPTNDSVARNGALI